MRHCKERGKKLKVTSTEKQLDALITENAISIKVILALRADSLMKVLQSYCQVKITVCLDK